MFRYFVFLGLWWKRSIGTKQWRKQTFPFTRTYIFSYSHSLAHYSLITRSFFLAPSLSNSFTFFLTISSTLFPLAHSLTSTLTLLFVHLLTRCLLTLLLIYLLSHLLSLSLQVAPILGTVVGQVACGEHHTAVLSSAPWSNLSADMTEWQKADANENAIKNVSG